MFDSNIYEGEWKEDRYNQFCTLALCYTVHMYTCTCTVKLLHLYCTVQLLCTVQYKWNSFTVLYNSYVLYNYTVQYC